MTLLASSTTAFLFSQDAGHPLLAKFANAQKGTTLNIDIDILPQDTQSPSRMYITNMEVELKTLPSLHTDGDYRNSVHLPIANGSSPRLSSGPLMLNVDTPGTFVSMAGTKQVPFVDGCWEMTWIADRPSGFIVCGFRLEEEVRRNDAVISPGVVYMNIPIWTRDSLMTARDERLKVEKVFSRFLNEQNEELEKLNSSNNPFKKVVHFQKASVANEKLSYINTRKYQYIPMNDEEMVSIGHDLLLFNKGTIWRKGTARIGLNGKSSESILLGQITVKKTASGGEGGLKP